MVSLWTHYGLIFKKWPKVSYPLSLLGADTVTNKSINE